MKISPNAPCPCGTGIKYKKCCQAFHKGKLPKTALELMRSRYCAFSLSLVKYIIQTTHKKNSDYTQNLEKWANDILDFSENFNFEKLTILEHEEGKNISFVTFKAQINSNNTDHTFTEKSKFEKVDNKWLYLSGEQL